VEKVILNIDKEGPSQKKIDDKKPLVSVITVVLNSPLFLEETIKSVINQSYDNVEYIIIDGNSTDNTINVIRKYENSISYWISEKDSGMYDALSKGFLLTNGELICYLNAGDLLFPKAIESAVQFFNETNTKWFTGLRSICNQKGISAGVDLPYQYKKNLILKGVYGRNLPFIQQESTIWHKDLMPLVDIDFLKNLKLAGDYYLWTCFSKKENLNIINTLIGTFRKHEGQLSENISKYWKEVSTFTKKNNVTTYPAIFFELCMWAVHPRIRTIFKKTVWHLNFANGVWEK